MIVIYQIIIICIGVSVTDVFSDQMFIIFCEGVLVDFEEYCFIYCYGELKGVFYFGL